jgi:hypothetical protein
VLDVARGQASSSSKSLIDTMDRIESNLPQHAAGENRDERTNKRLAGVTRNRSTGLASARAAAYTSTAHTLRARKPGARGCTASVAGNRSQFLEAIRREMVRPTLQAQVHTNVRTRAAELRKAFVCVPLKSVVLRLRAVRRSVPHIKWRVATRHFILQRVAVASQYNTFHQHATLQHLLAHTTVLPLQIDAQEKMARVAPHMTVAEAAGVMASLKASGTLVMDHDRLVPP